MFKLSKYSAELFNYYRIKVFDTDFIIENLLSTNQFAHIRSDIGPGARTMCYVFGEDLITNFKRFLSGSEHHFIF